jgi:hypothetical protein
MKHAEAVQKLIEWHRGAVLDEELFLVLERSASSAPRQATKWHCLAMLKRKVQERLSTVLGQQRISVLPAEEDRQRGRDLAVPMSEAPWTKLMLQLLPLVEESLREMQQDASSMPKHLADLAQFVVAHEQALVDFMRCEVEGRPEEALSSAALVLGYSGRKGNAT